MTELPVLIPAGFTIKTTTTPGTTVAIGDVLATCEPIAEEAINIAEKLETNPLKVPKMLKKNPGDEVEIGEVLAVKSGFFSSTQVKSKVAGTVVRYERGTGRLVIAPTKSDEALLVGDQIAAPVEGSVMSVDPTHIVIKTDKNVLAAIRGSGGTVSGETYLLEGKKDEDLLYRLDAEAIGKIILSEKVTRELLMKALGIGSVGIIALEITEPDLQYFSDKEKTVPLVMLEKDEFDKVRKHKEKKVFVNGSEKVVVLLR